MVWNFSLNWKIWLFQFSAEISDCKWDFKFGREFQTIRNHQKKTSGEIFCPGRKFPIRSIFKAELIPTKIVDWGFPIGIQRDPYIMCRGKVDVSEPSSLPGLKTSHKIYKDGLASSQLLSLLWVLEIDLESPVVESGVNNLCQGRFFAPKKKPSKCFHFLLGHVPFCQSLGLNHWGLLGSRVGFGWRGRLALMSVSKRGWFRFVKSKDKFIRQMFSMEDCLWS